jgi:lactate permease
MSIVLAIIPIALILYLMVARRWGAARAGAAGYLAALAIAFSGFGAGARLIAFAHAKALLLSLDVLLIIWAAFALYRVADEAGAITTIGKALPFLTGDRAIQALIIGWVFATFLQGVGGFGVPVAVIAPILVGLGFTPLAAVLIPSIGHGWAVTFGSLGSSFNALMAASGLPGDLLAPPAAVMLGIAGVVSGAMVAHAAGGRTAVRRTGLSVAVLGLVMAVVQYFVARVGLWNIASFAAGAVGFGVAFLIVGRPVSEDVGGEKLDLKALALAVSGYGALVAIILAVQLIPPVKSFLGQVVLRFEFPEMSTSLGYTTSAAPGRAIHIFSHTGAVLGYACLFSFFLYRRAGLYSPGAGARILSETVRKVASSSMSIVSMVAMAVVMEHAGMTTVLAQGLANGVGNLFPVAAPWIGALGAFMTGSNTNSNVVFGALQLQTATLLGYAPAIILAGQTAGAALASVVAPTKVVVGASTAGMEGREGEVMRRLFAYVGLLVALVSALTFLAAWLLGG